MDDDSFHKVLDLVYGAAVEPELWPAVLTRLSALTGSHAAVITLQNEETGQGTGIRAEPLPEAAELFYGHFATRNVFLQSDNARAAVESYRPTVLTDEHKVPKAALLRSEYYNDFMRRFDIHSVLMFRMAVNGMDTAVLNLHRTRRAAGYDDADIRFASALLPHLVRAFDAGQKIAASRVLTAGLMGAQDCSPNGLFLVDEDGRLRHANAAGRALLAGGGALRLLAGRLCAAAPDQARRLEGLIRRAASTDQALRAGGAMALPSPQHRARLAVSVMPAGGHTSPVFTQGRSAIVCVTDPDARLSPSAATLRELFGLTAAEARVALALFEGLDPPAVAKRMNLRVSTVRSHLAHIFDKTEAHSQVELTRLLMRTVGAGIN